MPGADRLQSLRRQIATLESAGRPAHGVLPFGDPRIDDRLPGGGLACGAWHALASEGIEVETGAAAGAFATLLARPLAARGAAVWVLRRDDLYAPGLSTLGFPAQRLIFVRCDDDEAVLAAVEDAARTRGVAVVVGEADRIGLVAGRRLQLACAGHGATALMLERRPFGGRGAQRDEASPWTRWRIGAAPSQPDNDWIGLAERVVARHGGAPDPDPAGPGPFGLTDADRLTDLLTGAGFERVALRRFDSPMLIGRDLEEAVEYALRSSSVSSVLEDLGPRVDRAELARELRGELAPLARPDGVFAPSSSWILSARAPG